MSLNVIQCDRTTDWVQPLPPKRIRALSWTLHAASAAADDRLDIEAVQTVLDDPKLKVLATRTGRDRRLLIGKVLDGPVVTLVVSLPDSDGVSRVITMWIASRGELAHYRQPGGSRYV